MKIALRGFGSRRFVKNLENSGATELVGGIHGEMFFDSFWPNPRLEEFLFEAASGGSFDLNPWMEFTQSEISKANFLRLRPRKVMEETDKDYEQTLDDVERLPWIGDDPRRRYLLPQHLFLSKIRLKPNQVAVVGQWTAEYVVPTGIRQIFEEAQFDGVEFRPIINSRTGSAYDDYFHLYANHALGNRVLDIASPAIQSRHPEEQGYDALGCICYDAVALKDAYDFNRTGERMVSFRFPDWVVRSSVRERFRERKLRGWAFEPALELGTEAYQNYTTLWSSLYELLEKCGRHTIRCRYVGSIS